METSRITLNDESQAEWQREKLEHLRYEYALCPGDLVIDVGAYRGDWAYEIFGIYGCNLILIEPTPWANSFEHGQVINKAAATYDGRMKFGGDYYYTSAHEEPHHEYDCFDINSLLEQHDEIALMKMNIEGDEYSLLRHIIGAKLHLRVKHLQVQFHQIEGEAYQDWYTEIAESLAGSHSLKWRFPFCWESWTRTCLAS